MTRSPKDEGGSSVRRFLDKIGPASRGVPPARALLGHVSREELIAAGRLAPEAAAEQEAEESPPPAAKRAAAAVAPEADGPARETRRVFAASVDIGAAGSGAAPGRAVNLSAGGAFIETTAPADAGDPVTLTFRDPAGGPSLLLRGRVRWVTPFGTLQNPQPGMGVAFTGLDDVQRRRLQELLDAADETDHVDHG
jgi:uncharacterized protein (TIGR02266 family)